MAGPQAVLRATLKKDAGVEGPQRSSHAVRRVPALPAGDYALFIAKVTEHVGAVPQVDLSAEKYLVGAAWHPVEKESPLGPLQPLFWGDIAAEIAKQL